MKNSKSMTEAEAKEIIDKFNGLYKHLAFCQYHISRRDGKTVTESVDDACNAVREVCDKVLGNG
jgi:hypothetical protein